MNSGKSVASREAYAGVSKQPSIRAFIQAASPTSSHSPISTVIPPNCSEDFTDLNSEHRLGVYNRTETDLKQSNANISRIL